LVSVRVTVMVMTLALALGLVVLRGEWWMVAEVGDSFDGQKCGRKGNIGVWIK
jgi:hypothetical protein